MAKKESLLDGLLDVLGENGGEILSELLGGDTKQTKAEPSLDGLFGGGDSLLEGLGDLVSDLTGIGASNSEASPVAKQTGEIKSSSTTKKVIRSASGKTAAKTQKAAAKPAAKKSTAKKTAAKKTAPAASTAKKKSSSTKKKTV